MKPTALLKAAQEEYASLCRREKEHRAEYDRLQQGLNRASDVITEITAKRTSLETLIGRYGGQVNRDTGEVTFVGEAKRETHKPLDMGV